MAECLSTSWFFTIIDEYNQTLDLEIACPIRFIFDVVHIFLANQSDLSSTSLFINAHQRKLKVPANICLKDGSDIILYGYGLKTVHTINGAYESVVCGGETCTNILKGTTSARLALGEDVQFPLINMTAKGALSVSVDRSPPSLYRLLVNHTVATVHDYIVIVRIKNQLRYYIVSSQYPSFKILLELPSATLVNCRVFSACREQSVVGCYWSTKTVSFSQILTFTTYLSLYDNYSLYNLALKFGERKEVGAVGLRPIQYFYRNKSEEYFKTILNYLNGEMRPYLKSNGGEQGSVLNSRLPGLFFSTMIDLNTNKPTNNSFYGPIRLYVDAAVMFNVHCNLYFADFYCHYKRHHVTIVLAEKSSPWNGFCQQYLTQLNIFNNPYLCLQISSNGSFVVLANMDVTVEVFYTETVNIFSALKMNIGFLEKNEIVGRGFALPSGVPKNPTCDICNLRR